VTDTCEIRLYLTQACTGSLCGAIFIDTEFKAHVRTLVGEEVFAKISARAQIKMMSDWESGPKRTAWFGSPENRKWWVDIPGFHGMGSDPETLELKG
jgi:hypothetical protein